MQSSWSNDTLRLCRRSLENPTPSRSAYYKRLSGVWSGAWSGAWSGVWSGVKSGVNSGV